MISTAALVNSRLAGELIDVIGDTNNGIVIWLDPSRPEFYRCANDEPYTCEYDFTSEKFWGAAVAVLCLASFLGGALYKRRLEVDADRIFQFDNGRHHLSTNLNLKVSYGGGIEAWRAWPELPNSPAFLAFRKNYAKFKHKQLELPASVLDEDCQNAFAQPGTWVKRAFESDTPGDVAHEFLVMMTGAVYQASYQYEKFHRRIVLIGLLCSVVEDVPSIVFNSYLFAAGLHSETGLNGTQTITLIISSVNLIKTIANATLFWEEYKRSRDTFEGAMCIPDNIADHNEDSRAYLIGLGLSDESLRRCWQQLQEEDEAEEEEGRKKTDEANEALPLLMV